MTRLPVDLDLAELVDALVSAVDMCRSEEVDRLRDALTPFGGTGLFNQELRLNGIGSSDRICSICEFDLTDDVEGWAA